MQYPAVFLMENSVQFEILKNMRMTMWNGLKLILHEIRKILGQIIITTILFICSHVFSMLIFATILPLFLSELII